MSSFWKGRRVFVTNPASFRGAWLCVELLRQGAQVFGYGGTPKTFPNFFELEGLALKAGITFGDLRDKASLSESLSFSEADVVLHTGADFSLKESRERPFDCVTEEVIGTTTLLECLRETATVRSLVVLSSDKVYRRQGSDLLTEDSPVAAGEIAPTSKLCSELVALSYREQFFSPDKFNKHKVALAVARVGAAFGGGDFVEDSLVYEAAKAFSQGIPFEVKKPHSVRSWIYIEDQVDGILRLAEALWEKGPKLDEVWNIASDDQMSVGDFAKILAEGWPGAQVRQMGSAGTRGPSHHPRLSTQKLVSELGRKSGLLQDRARASMKWYQSFFRPHE